MKQIHHFQNKTAVIVCHDSTPGPPHSLAEFLLSHHISRLLFIGHVNQFVRNNQVTRSYIKIYNNQILERTVYGKIFHAPEPVRYIHDICLTFYWSLNYSKGRIDYYIGLGNLNALPGIVLKKLGKVATAIYYVIDYIPDRFTNRIMNSMYHHLDRICAQYANATWNYGKGMIEARKIKWNNNFPHQLHTPHGVTMNTSIIKNSTVFKRYDLVYMGSLLEQQGLQIVIDAFQVVRKKIPGIHLHIIGSGPYKSILEQLVKKNNLNKNVSFLGYINDSLEVDKIISKAALAIATYNNQIGFVQYTEPSKVRRYLACGTPVLISKGTPLSEDILVNKCGIVCNYSRDSVADAIISALSNKKRLVQMRRNGILYAKDYTWDIIYTQAFQYTD